MQVHHTVRFVQAGTETSKSLRLQLEKDSWRVWQESTKLNRAAKDGFLKEYARNFIRVLHLVQFRLLTTSVHSHEGKPMLAEH